MLKEIKLLTVLALIIILIIATALFGCKTTAPEETTTEAETTEEEKFVIGMTAWTMADTFTVQLHDGIKEVVEAAGHEFIGLDNEGGKEVDNTRTLISKGVDGVFMCYWDPNLAKTSIDMLVEANIPVLAIDIPMPGTCFLGVNNYGAGFQYGDFMADWIIENWDGQVDLIMILDSPTEGEIVAQRFQGEEDALLEKLDYPREKVERQDCGGWADGALQAARPMLAKYPDAEYIAIGCESDSTAQGIMTAVAEAGKNENAVIMAMGMAKDAIHLVSDNKMPIIGGIAYFPDKYGGQGINQLIEMIKLSKDGVPVEDAIKQVVTDVMNSPTTGEYISQTIYINTEVVTIDNIEQYFPDN